MKGVIISAVLFVLAAFYVLTAFDSLGSNYLTKALEGEGTPELIQEALAKDEAGFAAKHLPYLVARSRVCKVALVMDEDYFLKVSKESLDRYRETPLKTHEAYGSILFERAKVVEQRFKPPTEAFQLFKEHLENFGTTKQAAISRSATNRMAVSYGMQ